MQFTCTPFKVIKRMLTKNTIWKSNTSLLVRDRRALVSKFPSRRCHYLGLLVTSLLVKFVQIRCLQHAAENIYISNRETSLTDCINKQPNVRHISNMGFQKDSQSTYHFCQQIYCVDLNRCGDQVKIRQNSSRWSLELFIC